jgi:hypothetical protein
MLRRSLLGLLCGRVCRGVEVCREGHAEASWRNLGNALGECVQGARIVFFFLLCLVVCDEIAYLKCSRCMYTCAKKGFTNCNGFYGFFSVALTCAVVAQLHDRVHEPLLRLQHQAGACDLGIQAPRVAHDSGRPLHRLRHPLGICRRASRWRLVLWWPPRQGVCECAFVLFCVLCCSESLVCILLYLSCLSSLCALAICSCLSLTLNSASVSVSGCVCS